MSHGVANEAPGAPWYRCVWPWFIVGLLSTAVVASLATVVIAVSGRDSLVQDDYYRDGLAINRRLESEAVAEKLRIGAELRFDGVTGGFQLRLHGKDTAGIEGLQLALSHPTRADRDTEVRLRRGADRVFRGSVDAPLTGRWYATLHPAPTEGGAAPLWRINQPVRFVSDAPIALGAGP